MKMKDIVKEVAFHFQLEDVLRVVTKGRQQQKYIRIPVTELTWQAIDLLKKCSNAAVRLIAQGYIPQPDLPYDVKALDGEMFNFGGLIGKDTVGYLAASEYAKAMGLDGEAEYFFSRFAGHIRRVLTRKKSFVAERKWF